MGPGVLQAKHYHNLWPLTTRSDRVRLASPGALVYYYGAQAAYGS